MTLSFRNARVSHGSDAIPLRGIDCFAPSYIQVAVRSMVRIRPRRYSRLPPSVGGDERLFRIVSPSIAVTSLFVTLAVRVSGVSRRLYAWPDLPGQRAARAKKTRPGGRVNTRRLLRTKETSNCETQCSERPRAD